MENMITQIKDIHTEYEALAYYQYYRRCISCGRRFGSDFVKKKILCHYCEEAKRKDKIDSKGISKPSGETL